MSTVQTVYHVFDFVPPNVFRNHLDLIDNNMHICSVPIHISYLIVEHDYDIEI